MKIALVTLSIILLVCSCTEKRTEDLALRFMRASLIEYSKGDKPLADTLFHYSVPIINDKDEQFIYVANPECSFCIASAISCCNAWSQTSSESPFYFLTKSDYTELFEFYMERDCDKKVPVFSSEDCSFLEDGLYTIRDGHVFSYSSWTP